MPATSRAPLISESAVVQGWDNLQAAVDAAVRDEKSLPLFQKAFEKFQEVSASGALHCFLNSALSYAA